MSAPHRRRWRLLFAWLVVFSLATGWSIRANRHEAHQGQVAAQALCAFKLDLIGRVDSSQAFLKTHPHGFAGIPAATIRNSIRNEQATVHSLAILHCLKETS